MAGWKPRRMPPDLAIRPATRADLGAILALERAVFPLDAYSKGTFLYWLRRAPRRFLVAERDGVLIGYVITFVRGRTANLVSLAIDPAHRRQGWGRALVSHVLGDLRAAGVRVLDLEVRPSNTAGRRFWESFGFAPVGLLPGYYPDGEDGLHLRLRLGDGGLTR
jgi:ribosomal-protein-alanine N-acetyltransferase